MFVYFYLPIAHYDHYVCILNLFLQFQCLINCIVVQISKTLQRIFYENKQMCYTSLPNYLFHDNILYVFNVYTSYTSLSIIRLGFIQMFYTSLSFIRNTEMLPR